MARGKYGAVTFVDCPAYKNKLFLSILSCDISLYMYISMIQISKIFKQIQTTTSKHSRGKKSGIFPSV